MMNYTMIAKVKEALIRMGFRYKLSCNSDGRREKYAYPVKGAVEGNIVFAEAKGMLDFSDIKYYIYNSDEEKCIIVTIIFDQVIANGLHTGDIQMGILGANCCIIYIRYPSSHRVDYIYHSVV